MAQESSLGQVGIPWQPTAAPLSRTFQGGASIGKLLKVDTLCKRQTRVKQVKLSQLPHAGNPLQLILVPNAWESDGKPGFRQSAEEC